MFIYLFIVVNKYYCENKYRNALMRIDYPKALDEQQKENENAKHEKEKKQSMERRRERVDEEVCHYYSCTLLFQNNNSSINNFVYPSSLFIVVHWLFN